MTAAIYAKKVISNSTFWFIVLTIAVIILIPIASNQTAMMKQDLENMGRIRICYVQCGHEIPIIETTSNATTYNGTAYMQCLRYCDQAFPVKLIIREWKP